MRLACARDREQRTSADGYVLEDGPVRVDLVARRVDVFGRRCHLQPKSFDVLVFLMRHRGRAVTRRQLLQACWDTTHDEDTRAVSNQIALVRARLGLGTEVRAHRSRRRLRDRDRMSDASQSDASKIEVFKSELHAWALVAMLDEIEERTSAEWLAATLARYGTTRAELADRSAWVSRGFCVALLGDASARIGNEEWIDHAVARGMAPKYLGPLASIILTLGTSARNPEGSVRPTTNSSMASRTDPSVAGAARAGHGAPPTDYSAPRSCGTIGAWGSSTG